MDRRGFLKLIGLAAAGTALGIETGCEKKDTKPQGPKVDESIKTPESAPAVEKESTQDMHFSFAEELTHLKQFIDTDELRRCVKDKKFSRDPLKLFDKESKRIIEQVNRRVRESGRFNNHPAIERKYFRQIIDEENRQRILAVIDRVAQEKDKETEISVPPGILYGIGLQESGFDPNAVHKKGAVGAMQFLPGTAREQGLIVDETTDERKDLEKSLIAAGRYLRKLYNRFGQWNLALAAYSGGDQKLARRLHRFFPDAVDKKTGKTEDKDVFIVDKEKLKQVGANIITLQSPLFAGIQGHSLDYPLWVERMQELADIHIHSSDEEWREKAKARDKEIAAEMAAEIKRKNK